MKTMVMDKGARITGPELGMGNLAGVDGFFETGLNGCSVFASEGTCVDFIEKKDLICIRENAPGIFAKLREFCLTRKTKMDSGETIAEKRSHQRFHLSGLTAAKLLDTIGIPEGKPFRGELLDLSEGGFAFTIRLKKDNEADKLRGRTVVSLIKIQGIRPCDDIFWGGQIVNVCKRDKDTYSLHLKADGVSYPVTRFLKTLVAA
jgi:hypothetical protein